MSTALLTATSLSAPPLEDGRRALVAGRSILHHQVEFCLQAGCRQVLCLAEHPVPCAGEIGRLCAGSAARFQVGSTWRELLPFVVPEDRLLVVAPDAMIDLTEASCHNDSFKILTLAADDAVPLGFERIDAARAWSGVMTVPARLFARLADLPDDIETSSALLRIALMEGVPAVPHHFASDCSAHVSRLRSAEDAERLDARLRAGYGRKAPWREPGHALVERLALAHGWHLLGRPAMRRGFPLAVAIAVLATAITALLGRAGGALLALCLTFALNHAGLTLSRFDIGGFEAEGRYARFIGPALDALLVLVVAAALRTDGFGGLFAAAMLVGLLRVSRNTGDTRIPGATDRIALGAVLAAAHAVGLLEGTVMVLALTVLAVCIYGTRQTKITTL